MEIAWFTHYFRTLFTHVMYTWVQTNVLMHKDYTRNIYIYKWVQTNDPNFFFIWKSAGVLSDYFYICVLTHCKMWNYYRIVYTTNLLKALACFHCILNKILPNADLMKFFFFFLYPHVNPDSRWVIWKEILLKLDISK